MRYLVGIIVALGVSAPTSLAGAGTSIELTPGCPMFEPDRFIGVFRVDGGARLLELDADSRSFNGQRQIDGWARVTQDSGQSTGGSDSFAKTHDGSAYVGALARFQPDGGFWKLITSCAG